MYICVCHGITDTQIRSCVVEGARTLGELSGELGVATQCGCCAESAAEVMQEVPGRPSPRSPRQCKLRCSRRRPSLRHPFETELLMKGDPQVICTSTRCLSKN